MLSPEVYEWVVVVAPPVASLIVGAMFLYGSLKSAFRVPFAVLALTNFLFLAVQLFWLVFKVQQSVGTLWIPREHGQLLFSVQAAVSYIAILTAVIGSALVVRPACRRTSGTNT